MLGVRARRALASRRPAPMARDLAEAAARPGRDPRGGCAAGHSAAIAARRVGRGRPAGGRSRRARAAGVASPSAIESGLAHAGRGGDGVGEDGQRGVDRGPPDRGRSWRDRDRPEGRPPARRRAAGRRRTRRVRAFLEWTPEGPLAYNPYAHGTATEVADKALAGELFTEPHYLRQAQRYLGHAVRVDARRAGSRRRPSSLMAHLDPRELEVSAHAGYPRTRGGAASQALSGRAGGASAPRAGRRPRPPLDPRRVRRARVARPGRRATRARPSRGASRSGRSSTSASTPTAARCSRRCWRRRSSATLMTLVARLQRRPDADGRA